MSMSSNSSTSVEQEPKLVARQKRVTWLSLMIGVLLTIIGIRFFLVPESASFTFGVAHPPKGDELHHIIAIRDVWLGLMAALFAWFREWRALAIWLVGAALTCWTDAIIVQYSTAHFWALAFHVSSGVFCLALARAALILHAAEQDERS